MLPANAPAWIDRLLTWLEPFEASFGHVKQRGAFRRYLLGLLGGSPRKSMSAMLARVSDPGDYQAFQHFLTHAPWAPDPLWRALRAAAPCALGILIIDGTSFPKQGTQSVGVARQYCAALGKIANCQVATTVAPVDRDAGLVPRRAPVSGGHVARRGAATGREDSGDGPLPGEVAPRALHRRATL